jgi:hypothetical protein
LHIVQGCLGGIAYNDIEKWICSTDVDGYMGQLGDLERYSGDDKACGLVPDYVEW